MKTLRSTCLFLILFLVSFNIEAQQKRFKAPKTVKKEYSFNPDYPDFYYGKNKVFLEAIYYRREADIKVFKGRYVIVFSGMSSSGYVISHWVFNKLEEFTYYQDLIENKKYHKILLKKPSENMQSQIIVLMHPIRKIPSPQ